MTLLESLISPQTIHGLGWTLLHFVWQGAAAAILLAVLLRLLRKASANLRYVVSCAAFFLLVLLPAATFHFVSATDHTPFVESVSLSPTEDTHEVYATDMPLGRAAQYMQTFAPSTWPERIRNLCAPTLPYVVSGWLIGVIVLCLWHLGGWGHLQRLKRKMVNDAASSLKKTLHNLAQRLRVSRPVKLMESALVQTPTVVGWLRPVILLPASAIVGLAPHQLEALLAHELAHIRRYDYLINMLQTVVEILGFYHPAVWWISHQIRIERENCCDDLAVTICGDARHYAKALAEMERIRCGQAELALAATGGNLSGRIFRLLNKEAPRRTRKNWAPPAIAAILVVMLAIPTTFALSRGRSSDSPAETATLITGEGNNVLPPAAVADETQSRAQILLECKICEAPAHIQFPTPDDTTGEPTVYIQTDFKDSIHQLEPLGLQDKDAKILARPTMIISDGKQGVIMIGADQRYTTGYEPPDEPNEPPKPIIETLFDGMRLEATGKIAENNAVDLTLHFELSGVRLLEFSGPQNRKIQSPIGTMTTCYTQVRVKDSHHVAIGGLTNPERPDKQVILLITPHIIRQDQLPEKELVEDVIYTATPPAVTTDDSSVRLDVNQAELRRQEQQELEKEAEQLQRTLDDIQRQLNELKKQEAELMRARLNHAPLKTPQSNHEYFARLAAQFAERGDFQQAIEHQEQAIELAKVAEYYGIGIIYVKDEDGIRVVKIMPDTPAQSSGLRPGDVIEAVDGRSIKDISHYAAGTKIAGPKDTQVILAVRSPRHDDTRDLTLRRQVRIRGWRGLPEYEWRLEAYKNNKTWPKYRDMAEQAKTLRPVVEKLDVPGGMDKHPEMLTTDVEYQIIALQHTDSQTVAEKLRRLFFEPGKAPGEFKDLATDLGSEALRRGQPREIVPLKEANQLIVFGEPKAIELVKVLVSQIDVAEPPPNIIRIFKLGYADCKEAAKILADALEEIRIVPDSQSNQLIISASKEDMQDIEELIAEIDVPKTDVKETVVLQLKYIEAEQLAASAALWDIEDNSVI